MSSENIIEIECSEENMKELENHCFSETRVEVGGFLLGKIENGKTSVNRVVKAKHTVSKSTQLTFTHKTWDAILDDIKKRDDGNDLIGWYHSHPNFGVFLSDHDQFIQNNFFKEDGRVTIVIDPVRGKRGWFFSKAGKIVSLPEVDTTREKLGESSTNPDQNITLIQEKQKQFVTLPALLVTSFVFSILSFSLGVLISQAQSSNLSSQINQLQQELRYFQYVVQTVPVPGPNALPTPTAKPSAKPTPTAKPSAKPTPTAKPSAKPTPTAKPTASPTVTPSSSTSTN